MQMAVNDFKLAGCIRDKSMDQETVSFRFIYLKQAMDRWGARIQNIWWIKYFDRRQNNHQNEVRVAAKEVGRPSSLHGQTIVDKSQTLHMETDYEKRAKCKR